MLNCDLKVQGQGWRTFPCPSSARSDAPAMTAECSPHKSRVVMLGNVERNNRCSRRNDAQRGAQEEPFHEIWESKEEGEGTGELKTPW